MSTEAIVAGLFTGAGLVWAGTAVLTVKSPYLSSGMAWLYGVAAVFNLGVGIMWWSMV